MKLNGTIKWFNAKKGYGFIESDDGDYFVHQSALISGSILNEGDKVTFEPVKTDKGKQAKNVEVK